MSIDYSPPTPEDLRKLKEALGYTGEQMAALFGLAGNNQWRKYTGGEQPREMSLQMLYFGLSRLELDEATIDRVFGRMRAIGAHVEQSSSS